MQILNRQHQNKRIYLICVFKFHFEGPGRLLTTGEIVLLGQWRLLTTGATVLEVSGRLLTTGATVLEGPYRRLTTEPTRLTKSNSIGGARELLTLCQHYWRGHGGC